MYDIYYDGIIKAAYDVVDYERWYDARSDAYDDWYDARSDAYDIWYDTRSDILVAGGSRAIPSYFGTTPPRANLGKVNSHGYELELRLNYVF